MPRFDEDGNIAAAAEIVRGADGDVLRSYGAGGLTPADGSLDGAPLVWSMLRTVDRQTVELTATPIGCGNGSRVDLRDVRAFVWATDHGTVLALRENVKPDDEDCQSRPSTVLRADLGGPVDGGLVPESQPGPEPLTAE